MFEIVVAIGFLTMEPSKRPAYEHVENHYVLRRDMGGDLDSYALHFNLIKRSGEPIEVWDSCVSACTMVLNNPRACAMPKAVFGFHAARLYNRTSLEIKGESEFGTKVLWNHYPDAVRAKLGKLTDQMVYIRGTDLLPACK